MTMHLLPVYFTTTKHSRKRKRKFSQRHDKARQEHEKFLKKMGNKATATVVAKAELAQS